MKMQSFTYFMPVKIHFGEGKLEDVGNLALQEKSL